MDRLSSSRTAGDCPQGSALPLRQRIAARLQEAHDDVRPQMASGRTGDGRASTAASVVRRLGMAGAFGSGAGQRPRAAAKAAGATTVRSQGHGAALFVGARQRVMVKAFIGRHSGSGAARNVGKAITQHLRYLAREGMGLDGTQAQFFGPEGGIARDDVHETCAGWEDDRHHFRLIISPEHGDRIGDLDAYVRSVMRDLATDVREPKLDWVAVSHFDTGHPHTHVLIRGRRANGKDLVIPRKVLTQGIRHRAEDRAQELLGDQSRGEAERGLFARTAVDRWTDIDAKMAAIAEANGGRFPAQELARRDVFGAVMRARLQRLERLGLVESRDATGAVISPDAKARLEGLQRAQDQIRSHWAMQREKAFVGLARGAGAQSHRAGHEMRTRTDADRSDKVPITDAVPVTRRENASALPDPATPHLTSLDVELQRRGQLARDASPAAPREADYEHALESRAGWLVSRGDAVRQSHGLGYRPEAWARLRDAEIRQALRDQLGIRQVGHLSQGRTSGVVVGEITTSLGRQAVIDRGVGHAIAPLAAGQELAVGQVIGRGLGIER